MDFGANPIQSSSLAAEQQWPDLYVWILDNDNIRKIDNINEDYREKTTVHSNPDDFRDCLTQARNRNEVRCQDDEDISTQG